jgi:hypothetical protein
MTVVTRPSPSKSSATKMTDQTLATRIVRYATASCVLGKLCATESRAEIVMIDVGSTGLNINQVNGGLTSTGSFIRKQNFPIIGGGNLYLNYKVGGDQAIGLGGNSGMAFAVTGIGAAAIQNFAAGTTIDAGSSFNTNYNFTAFKSGSSTAANFTTSNYVGFQFGSIGNYHYGWLQTTWDGTNYQINSGAYESTVNTAILAGAVPVPEPGTLALGSLALLAGGGAAVRRYRKQRQQQATTPAAEPGTEGPESASVS